MEQKKKMINIKAGEVIAMRYSGDNKPCDYGIGILVSPIHQEDGANGSIRTLFAMNAETGEFLPDCENYSCGVDVMVVRGKKKAWFFEKLCEHTKH